MNYTKNLTKGFSLIELMTAMTVFMLVMTISMGSILGVFNANRKSRSLKTVLNNLNLAVESMAKEMRFGENYHCGSGSINNPQDCAGGDDLMAFTSSDGDQITYRLRNDAIEKRVDSGSYFEVTSPEIDIDDLTFYSRGSSPTDTLQPKVLVKIQGHAGAGKSRSEFTIQTLVSQRVPDRDL